MEANELRIGNLVTVNNRAWENIKGKPLKVVGITSTNGITNKSTFSISLEHLTKNFQSYSQFIEFIEPIRISEKWFENLGFEEGSVGYYYKDDFIVTVEGQVYFGETEIWIAETHFIHQLQNLFFDLKKEELKEVQE